MRPIKFRAYHKDRKKMYHWYLFSNDGTYINPIESKDGWDESFDIEDCEDIQQFTGLLDKNGVEIYESDVVRVRGENAVVEYSGSCFVFVIGNREVYVDSENETCEVIGNIYENPELLTNK